jgi:hypothetical protein
MVDGLSDLGGGAIAPRDPDPVQEGRSGRGVPLYALRQGRSVATNGSSQISRIGGRMAMRPYGSGGAVSSCKMAWVRG